MKWCKRFGQFRTFTIFDNIHARPRCFVTDWSVNIGQRYWVMIHAFKPVSHQPCGSRAPIYDGKFLGFVRQPHGVVNNTARLSYAKQGCKAAATNFRHVHLLCDLFAFSERRTTAARHIRLSQDCCKTRKVFVRLTL